MTTNDEEGYALIPARRPAYPITAKAMSDDELAAAREYVDTVATQDQSGVVFRHICLLLGHADAHEFTKDEAEYILEAVEYNASMPRGDESARQPVVDAILRKLREAWL